MKLLACLYIEVVRLTLVVLSLDRTHIAVDWHPLAKDKFYKEQAAEVREITH